MSKINLGDITNPETGEVKDVLLERKIFPKSIGGYALLGASLVGAIIGVALLNGKAYEQGALDGIQEEYDVLNQLDLFK